MPAAARLRFRAVLPPKAAPAADAGTATAVPVATEKGEVPRTGVVFVHGIGDQKQSSTLREQGGPLLDWVWGWHTARGIRADDALIPRWSKLSYAADLDGPARFALRIPAYPAGTDARWPGREWIVAEGWWARRLEPPSATTMLGWGLRILGQFWQSMTDEALGRTHLGRGPRAAGAAGALGRGMELIGNGFLIATYVLLSTLSFPLVFALLLIAQIPIPSFQRFVLLELVRPLLVDRIGDFWIYLHDYPQAMHIRRAVEEAIDVLAERERCSDIVVVAHSQGTVVTYDALTSAGIAHIDKVRTLITVGAALNRAWTLEADVKILQGTLPAHIRWVDIRASYDPVPGEALTHFGERAHNVEITNAMNVLTDHDDYWRNPEEFLARVAQEVDVASTRAPVDDPAKHEASRFWPGEQRQRMLLERRTERTYALVFWRIAAFVLLAAAVVHRMNAPRADGDAVLAARVSQDGRAFWGALRAIPGGSAIATPLEAIGQWFGGALGATGGWLSGPLDLARRQVAGSALGSLEPALVGILALIVLAGILFAARRERFALNALFGVVVLAIVQAARAGGISSFEAAGMFGLALMGYGLLFFAAYLIGRSMLYAPWQEREQSLSSAPSDIPRRPDVLLRVVAMVLVLSIPAAVIAFWS